MTDFAALGDIVGTTSRVDIVRLNDDGDGVGKLGEVTVFVPGTLPGESVIVRVMSAHKRHLVAEVKEWVDGAPKHEGRVIPPCPVFADCGGCQLQHLSYQTELEHKRSTVVNALERIGHLHDFHVAKTIGMEDPWRYRNQIQVPLRVGKDSLRLDTGFFAAKSHEMVETSECLLVPPSVEETVKTIPERLVELFGQDVALFHHLIIRYSFATGDQMLILCARKRPSAFNRRAKQLMRAPIVSVAVTIQERPTGPVWGDSVEIVAGTPVLTEQLDQVEFLISPRSFFQVNTQQAGVLTRLVRNQCTPTGNETVLDAYCGTGTFSLTLAAHVKETIGIESVPAAIEDATRNAEKNGVRNAHFTTGQVERLLPKWAAQGRHFDIAVLDPPRKGCHPDVLKALADAGIPRIVYVSCNPATLARDVRILSDYGYRATEFQPIDMFPHTSHVECVVTIYGPNVAP